MRLFLIAMAASVVMSACQGSQEEKNKNAQGEDTTHEHMGHDMHGQHAEGEGTSTTNKKLAEAVLVLHDSVMENTMIVKSLKSKLVDLQADNKCTENCAAVIDSLEEAHDQMMVWMRSFNVTEIKDQDKLNAYLKKKEAEIIVVRDKTNASIRAARAILDSNK